MNMISDELMEALIVEMKKSNTAKHKEEIVGEFARVINRFSLDKDSDIPDFILARYLYECLLIFQTIECRRTMWRQR